MLPTSQIEHDSEMLLIDFDLSCYLAWAKDHSRFFSHSQNSKKACLLGESQTNNFAKNAIFFSVLRIWIRMGSLDPYPDPDPGGHK